MLETSHLYREIHEQPDVLTRFLAAETETARKLADAVRKREITHVVIAARGTSDNAGRYAKYLLGATAGLPVALATPSLTTLYGHTPTFRNALVLGISQSGKSPDIVSVVDAARRQGALTAAITNIPTSDLAGAADVVIDLHAGEERSVAATKTFTSELAAIALLGAHLAQDDEMLAQLNRMPEAVAATLATRERIAQIADRYRYMRHCIVIGRGYNYATAFELALKMKELTYTITEPYSSADFMHGPLALIDFGFPVIVIAPSGAVAADVGEFVRTLRGREAEVLAISDDDSVLAQARIPVRLPVTVPEWLSPMTAIVPGQLFSMYLAYTRDFDPDHPRGLRKVTETR
jgi:glucosamine--fructose-6-phosphate aminotransferase (isomerizing)